MATRDGETLMRQCSLIWIGRGAQKFNEFVASPNVQELLPMIKQILPHPDPCFPKTWMDPQTGRRLISAVELGDCMTEECWKSNSGACKLRGPPLAPQGLAHRSAHRPHCVVHVHRRRHQSPGQCSRPAALCIRPSCKKNDPMRNAVFCAGRLSRPPELHQGKLLAIGQAHSAHRDQALPLRSRSQRPA